MCIELITRVTLGSFNQFILHEQGCGCYLLLNTLLSYVLQIHCSGLQNCLDLFSNRFINTRNAIVRHFHNLKPDVTVVIYTSDVQT